MKDFKYESFNTFMIESVKISIKRNLDQMPFGSSSTLSQQQREEILDKIEKIADSFNKIEGFIEGQEFSGSFYKLGKISINEKKVLGNMPLSINENTSINDENFLKAA